MTSLLEDYASVVGTDVVSQLRQLAEPLKGRRIVHVNSTRSGGGVAEILNKLVPLKRELGLDVRWEVITGAAEFYQCTKAFHNTLQGTRTTITDGMLRAFERTNVANAEELRAVLEDADLVVIHDPQPVALLRNLPKRRGKWIWRCHIDVSRPIRSVWKYLRGFVVEYDASIFSLAAFAQTLPHPQYLIPPSIDPLSEKNMPLEAEEVQATYARFGLDPARPVLLQVSRFDRFKDPIGVIQAYRLAKHHVPSVQLVLVGSGAADDPEGEEVLGETRAEAGGDPDVHLLLLPPDAHRQINALQRLASLVIQKSVREGFGLTVTEALWKGQPVVGGDTGGIRLQVIDHHTGFLVNSPEGCALRIRYLLRNQDRREEMGRTAREFVRQNFLVTRHLRKYLTLMDGFLHGNADRIELA